MGRGSTAVGEGPEEPQAGPTGRLHRGAPARIYGASGLPAHLARQAAEAPKRDPRASIPSKFETVLRDGKHAVKDGFNSRTERCARPPAPPSPRPPRAARPWRRRRARPPPPSSMGWDASSSSRRKEEEGASIRSGDGLLATGATAAAEHRPPPPAAGHPPVPRSAGGALTARRPAGSAGRRTTCRGRGGTSWGSRWSSPATA